MILCLHWMFLEVRFNAGMEFHKLSIVQAKMNGNERGNHITGMLAANC